MPFTLTFATAKYFHVVAVTVMATLVGLGSTGCSRAQTKVTPPPPVSVTAQQIAIFIPAEPTPVERLAASELKLHLAKATGAHLEVRPEQGTATPQHTTFFVGATEYAGKQGINSTALQGEEWLIAPRDKAVVLTGGAERGVLYAVYHYLEDIVGVGWWSPLDTTIPELKSVPIPAAEKRGEPAFAYRDLYTHLDGVIFKFSPGKHAGKDWIGHKANLAPVVVRNRSNRMGDDIPISMGGSESWGQPYHIHTMEYYFPPKQYFDTNPEYFALVNGKRQRDQSQLCITNPELRRLTVEKLKGYIENSHANPREKGLNKPTAFWLTPNDWLGWCECDNCKALLKAEGGRYSGYLLDYVNFAADAIKDEYPDVSIYTLAYVETLLPPVKTKPRDNVTIYLCDTYKDSTVAYGTHIGEKTNDVWRKSIEEWSKITKHLRIWDYCDTFQMGAGLPMPLPRAWQANLQFYKQHNVEGLFSQFAYTPYPFGGMSGWGSQPLGGDLTGFLPWMRMKLTEDPTQDYRALTKRFSDGFYGPASEAMQRYQQLLEEAQDRYPARRISMVAAPELYFYLDAQFVGEATEVFEQAEQQVASSPELLRRVHLARIPLDRTILSRWPQLVKEKGEQALPNRAAAAERYSRYLKAEMDIWFPLDNVPTWKNQQDHQRYRDLVDKDIQRLLALN